ncbi:MAG: CoA transferase [Bdellovibrionales bacterium]|nr:CoA transferase [Bdellovibrionales bacterium]
MTDNESQLPQLPLTGVRVLDLTRVLAGPWCTQLLADMGADVIKIEAPDGDVTRQWGPPFVGDNASYFYCANRNKRAMTLDFNCENDLKYLMKLLEKADVIIENFKFGSLQKYGLDYDQLKVSYPKLIYCSIQGFSQKSDQKNRPGFDALIQAMSGLMSITGPSQGASVKVGVAVSDLFTGLYSSSAILAALIERSQSQLGQKIHISLLDTQVATLANVASGFLATGEIPKKYGSAHPSIVPYQVFQASDQEIMVAVGNDQQFSRFCQALGTSWDKDSDFQCNAQRVRNRDRLVSLIQEEIRKEPMAYWLSKFDSLVIPASPVQNLEQMLQSSYANESGLLQDLKGSVVKTIKNPIEFSRTPIDTYGKPPKLSAKKLKWQT